MLHRLLWINRATRPNQQPHQIITSSEDLELGCFEIVHTFRAGAKTQLDADLGIGYTPISPDDDAMERFLDVELFRGHGKDTPFAFAQDALQDCEGIDIRSLRIDLQVRDWGNGASSRLEEIMKTIPTQVNSLTLKRIEFNESKQGDDLKDLMFSDDRSIVIFSTIQPITTFPNLVELSIELARRIHLTDMDLVQLVQPLPALTTLRLNLAHGWGSPRNTNYVVPTLSAMLHIMGMRPFRDIAIAVDGESVGDGIETYRSSSVSLDLSELKNLRLQIFGRAEAWGDQEHRLGCFLESLAPDANRWTW